MDKKIIHSDGAPKALGPYSQGIDSGGFVFLAGQVPINPATGEVDATTAADQTRRCINNLKAVLEEAGLGLEHVVKTSVFLTSLDDFAEVNEAYAEFFNDVRPARSTIEVSRLPLGARIEIDAIAHR